MIGPSGASDANQLAAPAALQAAARAAVARGAGDDGDALEILGERERVRGHRAENAGGFAPLLRPRGAVRRARGCLEANPSLAREAAKVAEQIDAVLVERRQVGSRLELAAHCSDQPCPTAGCWYDLVSQAPISKPADHLVGKQGNEHAPDRRAKPCDGDKEQLSAIGRYIDGGHEHIGAPDGDARNGDREVRDAADTETIAEDARDLPAGDAIAGDHQNVERP
jgi:hypothetical protein